MTATDVGAEPPNMMPRRKRSWPRIVLLQLIVLIAGMALAEIGMRVWLLAHGTPFDSDQARERIQLAMSRAVDLVPHPAATPVPTSHFLAVQVPVVHPFTGYMITGNLQQIDFDLDRSRAAAPSSPYEILVVGGSVAAVFATYGEKRFVERLQADPKLAGRPIIVYEYGMGGFKQPQMVGLVQYLIALGFTPECVIDIDGFNEVALGNANAVQGSNPLLPAITHWTALTSTSAPDRETIGAAWSGLEDQAAILAIGGRALRCGAQHSAIASALVTHALDAHEAHAQAAFDAYSKRLHERADTLVVHGPPFQSDVQAVAQSSVRCWEEGSRSLRAMCDARGILYLHVLQPTLHDDGSKPLTPKEAAEGRGPEEWVAGVHAGYPLLRAAGDRLRAEGEHFVDATQIFAGVHERLYFDDCHFGPQGNVMLADRIADEMLALLKAAR
jgi:hypothetical protein